jgi:hypothetical protein
MRRSRFIMGIGRVPRDATNRALGAVAETLSHEDP